MEQRSNYIDILRGVLIFGVVWGHSISNVGPEGWFDSGAYWEDIGHKILYSFHMPLFIAVSGYLSYASLARKSWQDVLSRRIVQLGIPYVVWCTINLIGNLCWGNVVLNRHTLVYAYTGPYWFVSTLFILTCLLLLHKHLFRDNPLVLLLVLVIGLFLPNRIPYIGYDLSKTMFLLPYFLGAYYYARYEQVLLQGIVRYRWGLLGGGLLLFLLLLPWYDVHTYIYTTGYSLAGGVDKQAQLMINIYRLLIGVLGGGLVALLVYVAPRGRGYGLKTCLWLGRNSLGIYFVQEIVFSHGLRHCDLGWLASTWGWTGMAILVLGVSAGVVQVLKKSPYTKRVFLGA